MITADADTLMRQAAMTADEYLRKAISAIDEAFDERGYAKKHPELIAAFMQTCAMDFGAAILAKELAEAISNFSSSSDPPQA